MEIRLKNLVQEVNISGSGQTPAGQETKLQKPEASGEMIVE